MLEEKDIHPITVGKYAEENIIEIYYSKETAKVILSFYDAYNNKLKEPQEVYSQIGAMLENELYLRITDNNGAKWMMESSEPKNLVIKDSNNEFKLIYGEVKAKVLIKHINLVTGKAIVDDVVATVKLGGIYVPNIRQTVLDKNKWQWKYIGDENISIVTKENEQENIIILNYEEDRSNVILKYQNSNSNKLREDSIKEVQIGKEVRIDALEKFNDNSGLGWKYVKSTHDVITVQKDDNVVINYYDPLEAQVINKFYNKDNKPIIDDKIINMQVGKIFESSYDEKVHDANGIWWIFEKTKENRIIVKEGANDFYYYYDKLLADVTVNLKDTENNFIAEPIINQFQVGTIYEPKISQNFEDAEGKAWLFDSVDNSKIKVSEETENNIINIKHKKEMTDVKLDFIGDGIKPIRKSQMIRAQIGSIYIADPDEHIIEDNGRGWTIVRDAIPKFKVTRDVSANCIQLPYEKYMVDAIVRFVDDNGKDVIELNRTKHQVGTTYLPEIEDYINDAEGKEWIYSVKLENRFFTTASKQEPIKIVEDESKNKIELNYKPSMNKVTVRYVDPLGVEIKSMQILEAQIGSMYKPEILDKIIGNGNMKWMYNPNSKSTIRISRDEKENVVNLAYEEDKISVIYVYKDEIGEKIKESRKELAQIGTVYKSNPENVIEGKDGRVWEYKAQNMNEIKVSDNEKDNIIEVVYSPLNVDVILKFVNLKGKTILKDKIVKAQLGSDYKAVPDKQLADDESKIYNFVKSEPASIKIKEIPVGSEEEINVITLTYESLYGESRITFKDIDGNQLKDDEVKQMQVGEIFNPGPIQYITDRKGMQWEIINKEVNPIRIRENPKDNVIAMVYEIAKADVSVRYKDSYGNVIKDADIHHMVIGTEFIPITENEITDASGKKWTYVRTDPIKLTVGSINNIINIVYQEKKIFVTIEYKNTADKKLKEDYITKVQIGSKYVAPVNNKVIYDADDIWRFAYNSPSEITVSENAEENVIIQYFTDDSAEVKNTNENKTYFNPDVQKFIDPELVEEMKKEEEEKKRAAEEEKSAKEEELKNAVHFEDKYLQKLEEIMELTDQEKNAINKLNDCNTHIMKILHEALENDLPSNISTAAARLNEVISNEKEIVKTELDSVVKNDRTGNKILKIFEAITMSELNDKEFSFLQQKKSVLLADYFINNSVSDIEQATYIVESAKAEKGIECVQEKIQNSSKIDEELIKLKVILIYNKAMLDNYYRARSIIKDNYFEDESVKEKLPREVVVLVANMVPNQAIKLFEKVNSMTITQRNDLDALMKLVNQPQKTTIENAINKFTDGKTRKNATKLFKEYEK